MRGVRYEQTPLPAVHAALPNTVLRLFYGLLDSDLPGFVVTSAGPSLRSALTKLPLPGEIQIDKTAGPYRFNRHGEEDPPINVEFAPDYQKTVLSFRHTLAGGAQAQLFRPGVALARLLWERQPLPPDTNRLFRRGRVRPEILNRRAYTAALTAGSLLVYKAGGPAPLACHFRTAKAWQAHRTAWGSMPVG